MQQKGTKWVVKRKGVYWPSKEMKKNAFVSDEKIYTQAQKNPIKFWAKLAKEGITWFRLWKKTYVEKPPYFKWFVGGKLNASYNCLDRHVETWRKNKVAIIWESDLPDEKNRVLSYYDLYREVNKFANVLKSLGVRKGDRVSIYLPMIPEVQIAMLACARIGAIHSVVFSAFSPSALKIRITSIGSKVLITADGYFRRGKIIDLKTSADEGVEGTNIEKVIVVKRAGNEVKIKEGKDFWWHELIKNSKSYCEPAIMDSEDTLFLLHTSGTTGIPKAVQHSTGGYLTQAYWTAKWNFDLHDEDIFWCIPGNIKIVTNFGEKNISEIKVGDHVLSHEGKFVKVIDVLKRPYDGKLIKINVYYSNEPILITPNHKILVSTSKKGPLKWLPASEVKKGYYLFFPIPKKSKVKLSLNISRLLNESGHYYKLKGGKIFSTKGKHTIPNKLKIDENFARLCGYYMSEGSVDRDGIYFNFGKHEKFYIDDTKQLLQKIFNIDAKVKNSHRWAASVYVTSSIIANLFKKLFGKNAFEKKLPEWFINLPDKLLAEFVKGFWRGDGYLLNDGIEFNTTSETLAIQLKMMLLKLNIIPSMRLRKVNKLKVRYVNGRKFTQKHDIYRITVTGTSLAKILKILEISHPFIEKRSKTYHRGKITRNFLWTKVTSVSEEEYKGFVFNLKTESETYTTNAFVVHNCTADVAWITGHSYACYGPLLNGVTMLIHEGVPDYPQPDRWWEIIEKYGVTVFYTAPTVIRMLMRYGDEWVKKHDLSTLRILASVGEPIDRDAWLWYFNVVGGGRCPIIDTWWQTETGGTLINALPGIGPFIPAVAGRSFPGTKHAVLDEKGKVVKFGERGSLVQLPPFAPGMLRGLWKDPKRYMETYWSRYGNKVYYTGDGAYLEKLAGMRITGREDDVLKVAGHRLANAEIEDAINLHKDVVESAVIGMPDPIKGEVPLALVILKEGMKPSDELSQELIKLVAKEISPIAKPAKIVYVDDLPKTRSGKIMRRVLKHLIRKEELGDLSTLANPECVEKLKEILVG